MRIFSAVLLCAVAGIAQTGNFTTYIGDRYPYQAAAIATDAGGNTYITGSRAVPPTDGSMPPVTPTDVFVTKLDSSGKILLTVTFGGKGADGATGIAVDPSGSIYVAGSTTSTNFPLLNAIQVNPAKGLTGFLVKLHPDGSMVYSTFLGGTQGLSFLASVAADASGNAYVGGQTDASDYQRTPGLPAGQVVHDYFIGIGGISGAFFAKIPPEGGRLLYAGVISGTTHSCSGGSTCFLSGISTVVNAIAIDPTGNAYLAGNTIAGDIRGTEGAFLQQGLGAFVAKIDAGGSALQYLTFLGTKNYGPSNRTDPATTAIAIAADASGNAYITGVSSDPKFPTTSGAYQPTYSIPQDKISPLNKPPGDAFVGKLKPDGSGMVWATFFGGSQLDSGSSIALDKQGDVWIAGTTQSTGLANVGGYPGGQEFVAEFNAAGTTLLSGTLYPRNAVAQSIALDPNGTFHAVGATGIVSEIAGKTAGPRMLGLTNAAAGVLAGRIAPGEVVSIYGLGIGPVSPVTVTPIGGLLPTTVGNVTVTIDGTPAPLLYISANQINAVVPFGVIPDSTAAIVVSFDGSSSPPFRAEVDAVDPEMFLNPDGTAAAVNQDGSINGRDNPAKAGSYVSIWATGTGLAPETKIDGQVATKADTYFGLCSFLVESFSSYAQPPGYLLFSYAGTSPGIVNAVAQINFQIPTVTGKTISIVLSACGATSRPAAIYVSP